jgi:hypothetical protein
MRRSLIAIASAFAALASVGVASASAATYTVKVTPANLAPGGHWYTADTRPPGTGTFVDGPATPPYGQGSFELNTPLGPLTAPGAAKVQLFTDLFDGLALRYVDGVGYSTYRHAESIGFPAGVNTINMRVDLDGNGTADAYIVYEPYQDQGNGAVLSGVWQNWDAYRGGAARWWVSNAEPACTQATPCPWSVIVGLHPNATVREGAGCGTGAAPKSPCPGSFGVNQGSNNPGIISNADGLYLSVYNQKLVFDFERKGRRGGGDGDGRGGGGGRDD